jgi:hypothetical protein
MRAGKSKQVFATLLIASFGLSGCMEFPQTADGQKHGKYQGKVDSQPWDSAPVAAALNGAWTKGDRASWENHIKARNSAQNEYTRIGH